MWRLPFERWGRTEWLRAYIRITLEKVRGNTVLVVYMQLCVQLSTSNNVLCTENGFVARSDTPSLNIVPLARKSMRVHARMRQFGYAASRRVSIPDGPAACTSAMLSIHIAVTSCPEDLVAIEIEELRRRRRRNQHRYRLSTAVKVQN